MCIRIIMLTCTNNNVLFSKYLVHKYIYIYI